MNAFPPSAVGDLVGLVEAAARHPPTCHQLREVLNMGRNADKWTAFCKGLQDRVRRAAGWWGAGRVLLCRGGLEGSRRGRCLSAMYVKI
jgi:hypothetical protein